MSRSFILTTAVLAAVGFAVAASPAAAKYQLCGSKDFGNAPAIKLSANQCRALHQGQVRLVSEAEFQKYIASHPDYAAKPVPARFKAGGTSGAEGKLKAGVAINPCGQ
jgi:hypothetical protein